MGTTDMGTEYQVGITGVGSINGVSFRVEGSGSGCAASGKWNFNATFSEIPHNVHPFANLLGILIVPTAIFGREDGNATNLLRLANGILEFNQILRGDEIAVQSVGTIKRTTDRALLWHSEAEGEINIPELASVEPFDAVMLPQGPGKITETFALPFITGHGRQVIHFLRQFTFTPGAGLEQVQFRRITIRLSVQARTVTVGTVSIIRTISSPFRIRTDSGRS
jgi:hypothetical protein